MRVWLDTEFTDLVHPILISAGFAAEDGRGLYVEIAEGQSGGWSRADCNEFVRAAVLPQLQPEHAWPLQEAARRIRDFLIECGRSGQVEVFVDYSVDAELVRKLLFDALHPAHELARWQLQQLGMHGNLVAESMLSKSRHHHALDDARAFRAGRLADEDALRRDFKE